MTYPQQPQYAPSAAPHFPQQPGFPVQYQQMPPQPYAPQAYPQQYPAAPAAPPLPTGTLDGFFEQPSGGGGPSFKFNGKPIGTSYMGVVARAVTNADVRAQTDQAGRPVTFKDGRTKFVMVVPMQVQPSPEFPDGVAGWWVKGQARDALAQAMAEAGAPAGPPEAGATIRVTLVGQRQIPNMNPAFQYRVEYLRPAGAAPVQAATPAVAPVQPVQVPPAVQQFEQAGFQVQPVAPQQVLQHTLQSAMAMAPQPVQAAQPVQCAPQPAMVAPVAPPPVMAAPAGVPPAPQFTDQAQADLWAQLTGQQAQPQPQG